ncbi:glyoxylase-like metal-dependent hydrolase (beta-lactamase superfamily II) [Sphingomonas aerolata]|uniref:Glyoxylase-like metal-dependent hydrolase (Beta-lactamase superfamily II) n=1 Tax=Sphingomonas aerolata TaxID=185951 RepID=A0A2T4YQJ2_9SPHN|nr:MBL fold metallo-hydrolase [Sphingomonas aerolata]PTM45787.1 glyoxylase-like metal-dependent hydrolase (beta-lactamase superfamily II) [Sphingomonas aerolata]
MTSLPAPQDEPLTHKGLVYPLGHREPEPGNVFRIAPGVDWVRLKIPGPLRHVNCWMLADGDGDALVDTGMNTPEARDAWTAILAGPKSGVRITRVIGTHFHPDHIGLAGWLCEAHDAALVMTRGEWLTARMLAADARDAVPAEMLAFWRGAGWDSTQIAHASAKGWAGFRKIITPLPLGYTRITDGDVLTVGRDDWRVVIGSGHSPEHACLLNEVSGILIAGDQVLPRISPNISLGITEPHADPLGEWFAAIARLKTLPADLLVLPGHGDPFTGLHTRLGAMDREHRERLDELAAFLAEPRRAVECFGRLFRRAIGPDLLGMATGEALAHLRRLEVEGRAVRDSVDGVWWWRAT